ncbi:hypothetical protein HDU93_000223 [Gonapodya sp. JEL0774]|nr:hypothetical protein HDU93_000223 [Gonapodya sp. JEL0774]
MEVLRQHGIADEVIEKGCPPDLMFKTNYITSLGSDHTPYMGKEIFESECFVGKPGGAYRETLSKDSPCLSTNLPQLRLEPIIRARAEQRNPGKLWFSHEAVEFVQGTDSVKVVIRNLMTSKTLTIEATYVIAADGGRFFGEKLGIKMEGITRFLKNTTVHIKADLSKYVDDVTLISWITSPVSRGVLVKMGPTWTRHSEEWNISFAFMSEAETIKEYDDESIKQPIRDLLNIPDLELEVLKVRSWYFEKVLANKYQVGRIFLVGDAAHRHPPMTGLGLNTAIQDSHNIGWKLAAVLKGQADPRLLETYEMERRPVGRRITSWAFQAMLNHEVIAASLGFIRGDKMALIGALIELFTEGNPQGATRRAVMKEVMPTQRIEYLANDLDIGHIYPDGAFIADGTKAPPEDPMGEHYIPLARPGHRLPHLWVTRGNAKLSSHDFVGFGWLLITGEQGSFWEQAVGDVAQAAGLIVSSLRITKEDDPSGVWSKVCGIDSAGAILVRPDTYVAYRHAIGVPSKEAAKAALSGALKTITRKL